MRRRSRVVAVGLIIAVGLLVIGASGITDAASAKVDARSAGLPWGWLAFGFAAQAAFMARFLIQWIASERRQASVVPAAFWILSLLGGVALLVYFVRRGDPVGITGQAFGALVYSRNLYFIWRDRRREHAHT